MAPDWQAAMTNTGSFDAQTEADLAMSRMLKQIVVPIVDDPDAVVVQAVRSGDDEVTFVVQIAPEDITWFSGGMARTAESLRVIVKAAGLKAKRRFLLVFETNDLQGHDSCEGGELSPSGQ